MDTQQKILDLLLNKALRPADLRQQLGISPQALHRHLAKLTQAGKIEKIGKPPGVFYKQVAEPPKTIIPLLSKDLTQFIEQQYALVNSSGQYQKGLPAFQSWVASIGQTKSFTSLAIAYRKTRQETLKHFNADGFISGRHKLQTTFDELALTDVFFQDFYSLPQFGKTKLGCLLTMGKSGQYLPAIAELAMLSKAIIEDIIQKYKVEAIAFLPHSIPRKVSFLHEYSRLLALGSATVDIVKAFKGGIPIAQKSLSKLQERIDNAKNTIFILGRHVPYRSVLLIDDALGSGATMNETAKKLQREFGVEKIFGFALAGSYKGFDVIAEI